MKGSCAPGVYLTIARAGQKGVREGFLEEMAGSDFHRTEKDRCLGRGNCVS